MKNTVLKFCLTACWLASLFSCGKLPAPQPSVNEQRPTETALTDFGKVLAAALAEDKVLRSFIRKESLKRFDLDFDVLYARSSVIQMSDGRTFREALLPFAKSAAWLDALSRDHPLLTVYVPSLPAFDAQSWNTDLQIPRVAIDDPALPDIQVTDHSGVLVAVPASYYPTIPIVVVKNNERVRLRGSRAGTMAAAMPAVNEQFVFVDAAFDGLRPGNKKPDAYIATSGAGATDPVNIEAFHSGNEWQRDYVYYGITPGNPTGKFRNNFSEFITSFRFLNGGDANNFGDLGLIADQTDAAVPHRRDPSVPVVRNRTKPVWTEGNFEFRITIINNSKNGLGAQTTKVLSVAPQQLFDVRYKTLIRGVNEEDNPRFWGSEIMVIRSITPLDFNPGIEIGPWDLQNYGTAWKFLVSEFDDEQETATEIEHQTTYATNFSVDGVDIFKIGAKFGGSMTSIEKRSFVVKSTLGSDMLGEAALSFDQPIITAIDANGQVTKRSIATGGSLQMVIEPRRIM